MSREIKFRAWDRKLEVMHYTNPVASRNRHMTWTGFVYDNGKLLDYHMMQYTGLKDKNGIEIYEGDIIDHCLIEESPEEVVFEQGEFRLKYSGIRAYDIEGSGEIIGNIWEHPELLNK